MSPGGCLDGNSGRDCRCVVGLFRRVSAALAATAIVSGCTSIVSQRPVFPPAAFATSDNLLGVYAPLDTGDGEYFVEREGEAGLKIIGLGRSNGVWREAVYIDGAAVPLGDGDYVLQMSCVILWDDKKGWAPFPGITQRNYASYALVMQDRRAYTYWLLRDFSAIDAETFEQYGVARPDSGDSKTRSYIAILPKSMSTQRAAAFFRAVAQNAMAKPDDKPEAIVQRAIGVRGPNDGSPEAKAIVVGAPEQCRAIVAHYKSPE